MLASTIHHIQLQRLVCHSSCFCPHLCHALCPLGAACFVSLPPRILLNKPRRGFGQLLYALLDTPSHRWVTPVHNILGISQTSLFSLGDNLELRLSPQHSPFPFCLCSYDMRILPLARSLFRTLFLSLSHLIPALFLEILYSHCQMLVKRSPFPLVLSLVCSWNLCYLSPSLAGTGTNHGLLLDSSVPLTRLL